MYKYNHLMLDIETLGSKSGSVICSIGAVPFNLETGETGKPFYEKISVSSCLKAGLEIDKDTMIWWFGQKREVFFEMLSGDKPLLNVLYDFTAFISANFKNPKEVEIWGNGSRFDLGLLTDAYNASGKPTPWNYGKERDVRTLLSLKPEAKTTVPKPETAHHPVQDCLYQIAYCSKAYQLLNPKQGTRKISIGISGNLVNNLNVETTGAEKDASFKEGLNAELEKVLLRIFSEIDAL